LTTVVKVFLASPGGLDEERRMVRMRADHFNRMWSDSFGVYFRVVGWEDTPAAAMRPQERINKDAEDCELFIGLMWTRWGSETGTHTSGFEEEFISAQTRKRVRQTPEIALFFKRIDPDLLADPGLQLSKVLQFKNTIVEAKEYLFKEFEAEAQLADFVDQVFAEYAKEAKTRLATQSGPVDDRPAKLLDEPAPSKEKTAIDSNNVVEVIGAAQAFAAEAMTEELDSWSRLRLLLYSMALYAESRGYVSLGIHEVNRVFIKRKEWEATQGEHELLVRTMLRDTDHYTPGWFWLFQHGVDMARSRLWLMCLDDEAKKGAAAILAHDETLPSGKEKELVDLALADPVVGPVICELVGRVGTLEDLPLVRGAGLRSTLSNKQPFLVAEFAILSRAGAPLDLSTLVAFASQRVPAAITSLTERAKSLDAQSILGVFAGVSSEGREPLASSLRSARVLSPEIAQALLQDPNKKVREVAVWALIDSGRAFERAELNELFKREEGEARGVLMSYMNWVDIAAMVKASFEKRTRQELNTAS
jgi:Domain of unknown function (DUF4062)